MKRLRVSYAGRARTCRYPLGADARTLNSLLIDVCELPLHGPSAELVDSTGRPVPLDTLNDVHDEQTLFFVRTKGGGAQSSVNAGRGLVQLLGEETDSERSANDIIKSLMMPSIFSEGAEREGYVPIDSEESIAVKREHEVADPRVEGGAEEFRGRSYQNQLTKFNRILAHLVNDRTVLAWFRCNLAFVSLSLKYMKLASAYHDNSAAVVLLVSGGIFMILLPISWWSGYRRYSKCKELLDYDISRISSYLHKMGFDLDTSVFFMIMLLSFFTICYSSTVIIWTSTASQAEDDAQNDIVPG